MIILLDSLSGLSVDQSDLYRDVYTIYFRELTVVCGNRIHETQHTSESQTRNFLRPFLFFLISFISHRPNEACRGRSVIFLWIRWKELFAMRRRA